MNHLKRAWLSVTRRKGKTVILLIVVFILGNIIAGAFSIAQASKRVETNIKSKLGADATLSLDWKLVDEAANEAYKNGQEFEYKFGYLTLETLEEVSTLPQVKSFDYSLNSYINSSTVKNVYDEEMMNNMMRKGDGDDTEYPAGFSLNGVTKPDFAEIAEKRIEIVSGASFTAENVAVNTPNVLVSEKFASANGLAVGDSIEVFSQIDTMNDNYEVISSEKLPYELKIIGVFKPLEFEEQEENEQKKSEKSYMQNMYDNQFYASSKFVYELSSERIAKEMIAQPQYYEETTLEQRLAEIVSHKYVLNSPEDIDSFKTDAAVYLPEYFTVSVSSDAYDAIAGPIKSLDKMSSLTLYVAIGASILILSLVIVLFLRDRKHELGIYLSLGDKRGKVVSQILIEVMMIAFLGFTLSIFTGNVIAKSLSNTLVNQEKFEGDNNGMMYPGYYGPGEVNTDDLLQAYSVELNLSYVLGFYAIGLAVVALSTVVPTVYITRLNPKKIMM